MVAAQAFLGRALSPGRSPGGGGCTQKAWHDMVPPQGSTLGIRVALWNVAGCLPTAGSEGVTRQKVHVASGAEAHGVKIWEADLGRERLGVGTGEEVPRSPRLSSGSVPGWGRQSEQAS